MRNLRAIYNRAVEQGLTDQQRPFRHVYTGIGKTVKRAISLEYIRRIRDLELPPPRWTSHATYSCSASIPAECRSWTSPT